MLLRALKVRLILCAATLALTSAAHAHLVPIAFYYGAHPPRHSLQAFRWVVVSPGAHFSPRRFDQAGRQAFAYTSVGEASPGEYANLSARCVQGTDRAWGTRILNEARRSCRRDFLHHVLAPLWKQGYRGFFLDDLDAYRQAVTHAAARARQREGLIRLIRAIKTSYPRARLILNRGFRLLPAVHTLVTAVAAESLFDGWDQKTGRYLPVPVATRRRLLRKLFYARRLGLPVIAIDYLPARKRRQAIADARRIAALGISPYVTNGRLSSLGVGTRHVMPRKILMLYSGPQDAQHTSLNWYAAMPLNYLGYSTHIENVADGLPQKTLAGRYAGIVTWFENDHVPQGAVVYRWLRRQMHDGVPVVILGSFGFPADIGHLRPLGLSVGRIPRGLIRNHVVFRDPRYIGFETRPVAAAPNNFLPLTLRHGHKLLVLQDARGQTEDEAGLTPWGGYALSPDVVSYLGAVPSRKGKAPAAWILNPFRFLRTALRLPAMPVPDTTTESGRRLLMAQIDGDGFANKSWIYRYRDHYAGDVILRQILDKYPLPTSASFIVSYFTPHGLFPKAAAHLTAIARRIAALPWVEVASHTFSHPFNWPALEHDPALMGHKGDMRYGYALTVPGYTRFSAHKEIGRAIRWINRHIAPPGKRVSLLQWSGDCDPDARVLALSYRAHVLNLNGGGATETYAEPFVTKVRGLGIFKGDHFQVYAPMQDENVYTHSWTSPYYYGYVRAIQTFKLTNSPRRLKPLDIYYHFYSGARVAGLRALRTVITWALRQRTDPIFPSQFARIAVDFGHAVIARGARSWYIADTGALREWRIPVRLGYPRLRGTEGLAGFDRHGAVRYIHIAPPAFGAGVRIRLVATRPRVPYVHDANATITRASYDGAQLSFALDGHMPLHFRLANAAGCQVLDGRRPIHGRLTGFLTTYHLEAHHGRFTVRCP